MTRLPILVPMAAGLAVAAAAGALADDRTERGHALADSLCARCHAIGTADDSPHPEAPPFRTLSERYPVAFLEESLAEGIVVGHPDMPAITLPPEDVGAFLAYLESIQETPGRD